MSVVWHTSIDVKIKQRLNLGHVDSALVTEECTSATTQSATLRLAWRPPLLRAREIRATAIPSELSGGGQEDGRLRSGSGQVFRFQVSGWVTGLWR